MNGFILLIPFLIIRFGILSMISKESVKRAAYFAPMSGNEIIAYWIYQIANVAIFIYLCFLKIMVGFFWPFYVGIACYLLGLLLCSISTINFALPSDEGFNFNGLYRFSRNPMYVSYFLIFAGCAMLTQSLFLFMIVLVFQISSHWIILAEERWCIEKFGEAYRGYMKKVRRYI